MNKGATLITDIVEASLLYDFYGQLLSKRQQEVLNLYYEENLSLSEIAEEFGISRQGVHDTLKKAEQALVDYEKKLGLVQRWVKTKDDISRIQKTIDVIVSEMETSNTISYPEVKDREIEKLKELKDMVKRIEI